MPRRQERCMGAEGAAIGQIHKVRLRKESGVRGRVVGRERLQAIRREVKTRKAEERSG